jgi:NDP-sugar pyrophosphorylase family protein
LTEFHEKPVYHFDVSMGIYCLSRSVVEELPKGQPYGFDRLMLEGIKNKNKIYIHKFDGFWLDIGRTEDYQYADEHFAEIKNKLRLE